MTLTLEIITGDKALVTFGQLDTSRDERVGRRPIDIGVSVENGSDRKDGRRRDLFVRVLNGVYNTQRRSARVRVLSGNRRRRTQQVVGGIVDPVDKLRVPLGISSPKDDDLVQPVLGLEIGDILPDPLDVLPLVFPGDDIVRPIFLIGSDEIRVIDRREGRSHLFHERGDLALEVIIEHLGAGHGLIHGHARNVPTA